MRCYWNNDYRISSPISRAIFQYLTQKFGRFFHKKRASAYSRGFGIQKISTNLVLCEMTVNSVIAAIFTWHALKWQQRISDHQSDSLLPTHWKTMSLNSVKSLLISLYKWNIWSLCRENHSIACSSSSGHLGVKRLIFARLVDILSLPEIIVVWYRLQRRTMDSLSP